MHKVTIFIFLILILAVFTSAVAGMSVTITSPQNGSNFQPCQSIMVSADATADTDIKHVQFNINGKAKKRDRSAPFEYEWKNMQAGFYEIVALVVDTDANELYSEPIYITVGENQKGTVLTNGDFFCGLTGWDLYTATDVEAELMHENSDSQLDGSYAYVEVTQGFDNIWYVQLQQNMAIDSGHTYQVYFNAEVYEEKKIGIAFQHQNNPWPVRWVDSNITITEDEIDYGPYEFVCEENDPLAQFKFLLAGSDIDIAIDNVRVLDSKRLDLAVRDKSLSIDNFILHQNYPNPFNPRTTISFDLLQAEIVSLHVIDILGREISTLLSNQHLFAGTHSIQFDASNLTSAIYFYKLQAGEYIQMNKMMLIK